MYCSARTIAGTYSSLRSSTKTPNPESLPVLNWLSGLTRYPSSPVSLLNTITVNSSLKPRIYLNSAMALPTTNANSPMTISLLTKSWLRLGTFDNFCGERSKAESSLRDVSQVCVPVMHAHLGKEAFYAQFWILPWRMLMTRGQRKWRRWWSEGGGRGGTLGSSRLKSSRIQRWQKGLAQLCICSLTWHF